MTPTTLASLARTYDAFLIDQFGVILNGSGAYPTAPATLSRLAALGKPILFLSNSGKRAGPNEARLTRLGFQRGDYLGVLSSGETAFAELSRRIGTSLPPGAPIWTHTRDDDTSPVDGLGLRPVARPEDAALILLSGSRGDTMLLSDYEALLRPAAAKAVPMLCANPDMEMLTPVGQRFGAGRVARLYAGMGGPVEWIGKPHPMIYAEAARRLRGIPAQHILCIGDSPAHDVAGGRAAGHATALVRTGIHADLTDAEVLALCVTEAAVPDHILPSFDFSA